MGLLDHGVPLDWEESLDKSSYVRKHGIIQFLNIYNAHKNRLDEELKWGDELEYQLVHFDQDEQVARSALGALVIVAKLSAEESSPESPPKIRSEWHPEYADSMIEALPFPPYTNHLNDIPKIQESMHHRRKKINDHLNQHYPNVHALGISMFPLLGAPSTSWLHPFSPPSPETSSSKSIFLPQSFINQHPRFGTLTRNIRMRRRAKVHILTPIYKDLKTSSLPLWNKAQPLSLMNRFSIEKLSAETPNPVLDHIYMDAMGFGMGASCEQVTFMCPSLIDTLRVHDNFVSLGPFLMALTACSSIQRGMLSAIDCRWNVISQCVDCRTENEINGSFSQDRFSNSPKNYEGFNSKVLKSRYAGISLYLSPAIASKQGMNDIPVPLFAPAVEACLMNGVPPSLSTQIGFLLSRDPMVIFSDYAQMDDSTSTSHFENFQSTNWNSVRLKPPPSVASPIGWRVEFRVPELQITDFENAAIAAVLLLFVRALLANPQWEICVPMSHNDTNLETSSLINAVTEGRFVARKNWKSGTGEGRGDEKQEDEKRRESEKRADKREDATKKECRRETSVATTNDLLVPNGLLPLCPSENASPASRGASHECDDTPSHTKPLAIDTKQLDHCTISSSNQVTCTSTVSGVGKLAYFAGERSNGAEKITFADVGTVVDSNTSDVRKCVSSRYHGMCEEDRDLSRYFLADSHPSKQAAPVNWNVLCDNNIHHLSSLQDVYAPYLPFERKLSFATDSSNSKCCYQVVRGCGSNGNATCCFGQGACVENNKETLVRDITLNEFFNGSERISGLLPALRDHLNFERTQNQINEASYAVMSEYLDFLEKRAKGELCTGAQLMRQYVLDHKDYKQDSVVSPQINYDLLSYVKEISEGKVPCEQLIGRVDSRLFF